MCSPITCTGGFCDVTDLINSPATSSSEATSKSRTSGVAVESAYQGLKRTVRPQIRQNFERPPTPKRFEELVRDSTVRRYQESGNLCSAGAHLFLPRKKSFGFFVDSRSARLLCGLVFGSAEDFLS